MDANLESNLKIDNGVYTSISGVIDVISYNPVEIILNTHLGTLTIRGENLSIDKLDVENNFLTFKGMVLAFFYNKSKKNEGGILKKLLK